MACELWTDKLDAYLDGELPANDEQALRKHLRECPACAADVLERMEIKRSIRAEGMRFRPDPAFRARIERKISGRGAGSGWQWQTLLAFAAGVLVLAALWTNHFRHTREQQLVSELVDLHVATLASSNPVDVVSTDRHTVKPWFEGKLPFTFDLPDLAGSEFSLVGGRTAFLNQSAGAELIFRLRQHNLSVFIFPESSLGSACAQNVTASKLNFHLQSWSRDGLCYFGVGDVSSEDLGKLATLMKS